jgi:hypothetical protein
VWRLTGTDKNCKHIELAQKKFPESLNVKFRRRPLGCKLLSERMKEEKRIMEELTKKCSNPNCDTKGPLLLSAFHLDKYGPLGHTSQCKACRNKKTEEWRVVPGNKIRQSKTDRIRNQRPEVKERHRKNQANWAHRNGIQRPMETARDSSVFLGIYVAETVLGDYFEDVKRMPRNNPGFDFVCKNGYRIDVKSSTLRKTSKVAPHWKFSLKRNDKADAFLCVAFDNLKDLNPVHVYLIPAKDVRGKHDVLITLNTEDQWKKYEKPIGKVIEACNLMKSRVGVGNGN